MRGIGGDCREPCSSVNMLINNTSPNIEGINKCLFSLCEGGFNSLPYADADVVGIGVSALHKLVRSLTNSSQVFASYVTQCALVVILLFGLTGFEYHSHRRRKQRKPSPAMTTVESEPLQSQHKSVEQTEEHNKVTHRSIFENALVHFHKAQCYFSATLQIASLSYGIFETDMLVTFMLTPLATNGVLPVVFTYIMLIRCGKATPDVTLLSLACWLLSTIVYWILYSSIIPINTQIKEYRAYQQFMYKLSAIDACGGYSALAVCPNNNFELGRHDIARASHRLRVLTPIIWAFSTLCLLAILFVRLRARLHRRKDTKQSQRKTKRSEESMLKGDQQPESESALFSTNRMNIAYYLTILCLLAGIGMQLSLLSIGTSLKMMNQNNWGFGQLVAVTLWAPAVFSYIYEESEQLFATKTKGGVRGNNPV
jgi:hypothetical protein